MCTAHLISSHLSSSQLISAHLSRLARDAYHCLCGRLASARSRRAPSVVRSRSSVAVPWVDPRPAASCIPTASSSMPGIRSPAGGAITSGTGSSSGVASGLRGGRGGGRGGKTASSLPSHPVLPAATAPMRESIPVPALRCLFTLLSSLFSLLSSLFSSLLSPLISLSSLLSSHLSHLSVISLSSLLSSLLSSHISSPLSSLLSPLSLSLSLLSSLSHLSLISLSYPSHLPLSPLSPLISPLSLFSPRVYFQYADDSAVSFWRRGEFRQRVSTPNSPLSTELK